ncbi:protein cereblon-like [Saccostrea echinata]|uniref:protein cereblon-like n=1 Tax=Saccostrea echinata TaxID=191078 RepID=UPI002A81187E|nr:protein cereblon-like [Saccostrea echinata]
MDDDLLPLLGIGVVEPDGEDDDSSSGSEESETSEGEDDSSQLIRQESITFDQSLPVSHSYLGDDLEDVRGRTYYEEGSTISIPVIQLPGMVLVPDQTIPLHLFHQHTVAMLKGVMDKDNTFGIVAYRFSEDDGGHIIANIGTTAEIFSVKDETDDRTGLASIRVKAKGRQRFKVMESRRTATGILMCTVKILEEKVLGDVLSDARPTSHCKFCCEPLDQGTSTKTAVDRQGNILSSVTMFNTPQVNRFSAAYLTWWPPWVYKMYDPELVVRNVKRELFKWNTSYTPEKLPSHPVELSYWLIQNLPLDDNLRLNLLGIDSAIQRLRCSLSIVQKCSTLCCKECNTNIANKNDVFCLSVEGPLGAYVNPQGYVHETMTVYKAQNLNLIGRATKEHSWFPGYAWTIAQCRRCAFHIGWKFTATRKELTPQKFFGLTRASVIPGLHQTEENEGWVPVM